MQIRLVYSYLFLHWPSSHVQIAVGEPVGLESVSRTDPARFTNALQTSAVTYLSTHLMQSPRRRRVTTPNPVMVFKDRRAIEPSKNAVAAMLHLYDHIGSYVSNLGTELFTENNATLTFILGSLEVFLHVASWTARTIPGRTLLAPTTRGDVLPDFVKELRDLAVRGLIAIGKVALFVNNLICLTMVIAVLGPHTRRRPNAEGVPELVT